MPALTFHPTSVFYVIIGVLVGMVIGWLMGFFDSNNRTSTKIHAAEMKAEKATKEAQEKIARSEQQLAAAAHSASSTPDNPGLLRLREENGRYLLEIDGVSVPESPSTSQKKRLIDLITVFRPYLESGTPQQSFAQPAAPTQTPPVPASVAREVSRPLQSAAPKKAEPEKNISSLSIVGQIDVFLQKRLLDSPFEDMGIRLQESLQGGVEVYVGLKKYGSIDEVPDEAIKTEIRAAIADWEQKYTPGLK